MDYNHVTLFLEKFKKLLFQKEGYTRVIAETITKHIGTPIDISSISTKGSIIHIQGSPVLRNEVLIHKQGILSDLEMLISGARFTDIR